MAITSLDDYIGAAKQRLLISKAARSTSFQSATSVIDVAGMPGAGVLAGTSTTAGVVPTDADAGFPVINAFGGGALGYLTKIEFSNVAIARMIVFDLLFKAGAYAYNANTGLTSQPSFASRVPNSDYKGLEIWAETVTATTGTQAWEVTYTNEGGTGSRTTGATSCGAAPGVGRMWRLPLQTGDLGVQSIDNVKGTVASAGTGNILVMRRLWTGRINGPLQGEIIDLIGTGMPRVFDDSALMVVVVADGTSTGACDLTIEIANG